MDADDSRFKLPRCQGATLRSGLYLSSKNSSFSLVGDLTLDARRGFSIRSFAYLLGMTHPYVFDSDQGRYN